MNPDLTQATENSRHIPIYPTRTEKKGDKHDKQNKHSKKKNKQNIVITAREGTYGDEQDAEWWKADGWIDTQRSRLADLSVTTRGHSALFYSSPPRARRDEPRIHTYAYTHFLYSHSAQLRNDQYWSFTFIQP